MPPHEQNWCCFCATSVAGKGMWSSYYMYGDIMFDKVILAIVEICQCGYNVWNI